MAPSCICSLDFLKYRCQNEKLYEPPCPEVAQWQYNCHLLKLINSTVFCIFQWRYCRSTVTISWKKHLAWCHPNYKITMSAAGALRRCSVSGCGSQSYGGGGAVARLLRAATALASTACCGGIHHPCISRASVPLWHP